MGSWTGAAGRGRRRAPLTVVQVADDFDDAIRLLRDYSGADADLAGVILEVVRVTGASVSTMGFLAEETISASDRSVARLDEAQFDLGEGPCWDAVSTGAPVSLPDLRAAPARWPALEAMLRSEPIGAVHAFPMLVGSLAMGALDLYHVEPYELDDVETRQAAAIAEVLGRHVLRRALVRVVDREPPRDDSPFSRRIVHQATGFVVGQLGVSVDEATLLIQGMAFSTDRSMREVGQDILNGSRRFEVRENMIEDER